VDGQPFAGADLFNNKKGLYEFRCGGTTNQAISESCTKILSAFITQLRQSKPKADYCGQQGSIPSGFVITRPPPFWMRWEFIVPITIFVFGIGFAFAIVIRRGQIERKNYKLKEQAHIIERQRDLEIERNRIANELHDELGSGLTSIQYWSEKGIHESKSVETTRLCQQINERSQQVMDAMREIIWAMNTRFDQTPYLTAYLHHFAAKFADEHDLKLKFQELGKYPPHGVFISGEVRRNLFYIFKEILCNIVKHSSCTSIILTIEVTKQYYIWISEEDGIGFDPETCLSKGNGIYNIRQRINAIHGEVKYTNTTHGTDIVISVPLN
jgi:signal transduction histidine kinase